MLKLTASGRLDGFPDSKKFIYTHMFSNGKEVYPWVGEYLLIAAINRTLDPTSKNGIAEWVEKTVVPPVVKTLFQKF